MFEVREEAVRTLRDEDNKRRDDRTWSTDDVRCLAETKDPRTQERKSILVDIDGEEYWVPYSAVHDDSDVYAKGDTGKLVVAFWWAKSRGLVEDDDS
jgi:hypothetical protein